MFDFPSSDVEMPSSECAPGHNGEDHGHARVNSSPTRPSDICRWPSVEKRTPPRRPHLRSLDLASASPPSTPSYLSPAFPFAPKSAGITRTVTTRATSYAASLSESLSLAALNLDPSSADELSDEASVSNDYVDLNDSPTLKLRPLPHARSSISSSFANSMESPSKATKTNFPSLTASPHRREFFPRSPARVPALATPPLTPSSSFASADTTRSEHDEQDSEAEDRSPASWYDVRRSETFKHAFQPVEYDDRDGAQMVSFNTESHGRYISGMQGILRSDANTSPVRKTAYTLPVPESPTPVRGRRISLRAGSERGRSISASSDDDYQRFIEATKPRTPALAPGFNDNSASSGDPFVYSSPPAAPPHVSLDYRHGASMHFDAGFSAYNHPPYNFPSSFGPTFQVGASPPNHGLPAHPPLPVGHHALDAAMARAYVDGQGPAMYHTQAIPFEPANPSVFGFPPSRNPSPPNRQLARSSTLYTNRHSQRNGQHGLHRRNVSARTHGRSSPFADMSHKAHPITPPPSVPDKNILNVDSIASGGDTRTTVMIKNIPNKMTDEDLLSFINRVSPGRIDFFYLRMDFTNGCNVGYAFVNFITPEDLLHFARTQLGVKWNMYSSEKVLQLSYANYQGKEALVEKFRNSGIMDERPAWRPRIFYSSGHHQGMPQPFPQPTHLRRKERSANNRGTLFVPAPAALGPRQHHVHVPPPAYWGPPGFGYGGCQWVPQ